MQQSRVTRRDLIAAAGPDLADPIQDIVDLDVPESKAAQRSAIDILPSTTLHLVVQYRTPMTSVRRFGELVVPHQPYWHIATALQTGVVTIRPRGPVGAIVVSMKPEAAASLLGSSIQQFADKKIELGSVFSSAEVSCLVEKVAEARSSYQRRLVVLQFIAGKLRARVPDPLVSRAAADLRSNPSLRVAVLAAQLGVSERHLSRRFKSVFGTGLKWFARIARVERALATRGRGLSWAEVACSCGFADQAHMVNDFNAILGFTPDHFLRRIRAMGP